MKSIKEMVSTLNCGNMLECVFGLAPVDVRVYEALLRGMERIEEISKAVGKGESAVYKSLQRLLIAGMAYRIKMPLEGGGYYFIYKPTPKEKVAEEVDKVIQELCVRVKKTLEEFLNDSSPWMPGMRNM
ncbi:MULTISPECIES: helix-turn-helix domain-containing protein [unclassified Archaeoglobus]|jgi:predicted transcriptional regulator|uniref:helix-turn-helix domain-containing protein n=1 Tax=unclassified Archaeoglobus TaxID=2643606 RepID=UPI0025B7D4E1|nr:MULTISPECIES: helix-turn-helix domain-containing protein [unclassified Archaeoglobus]